MLDVYRKFYHFTGEPFRLGVAVTREGARTLCVVEGQVRGSGYDRVVLVREGVRYMALGAGVRVSGNWAGRASGGGSKKS